MDGSMGVAVCVMEVSCRSAVAGLDTLLPLHTVVASARLKSCIAVDPTCWCSLSHVYRLAVNTKCRCHSEQRGTRLWHLHPCSGSTSPPTRAYKQMKRHRFVL
ncbi:hypothetical protein ZWY2020_056702 [Hordeum vulgare]|nr:hypothetical protein ZWY2020_056702 [Hordeum vulgare]